MKTGAVPVQLYDRRAEKRLLWLTFSAIVEPEIRAAKIAIWLTPRITTRTNSRNGCCANQIRNRNAVRLTRRLVGEGHLGSNPASLRGQGSILRHECLPPYWVCFEQSLLGPFQHKPAAGALGRDAQTIGQ